MWVEVLASVPIGGCFISYATPSFHAKNYHFGSLPLSMPPVSQAERPFAMMAANSAAFMQRSPASLPKNGIYTKSLVSKIEKGSN
jgi:hypothetical protein